MDDHERDVKRLDKILGEVFCCIRGGDKPSSETLQVKYVSENYY